MSADQVRNWCFSLLLLGAAVVGLIEWQRPSTDYFWRDWAEQSLRAASEVNDGSYCLKLADWAFRMKGDDADPKTVRRLGDLLLANRRFRERSALLAFEALRKPGSTLDMLAFEAHANVLTAWLAATSLVSDGKPVPLAVEAQLLSADWRYSNHYACRKQLAPSAPAPLGEFGGTALSKKWGFAKTLTGEGLFKGSLTTPHALDHAASAKCVVERETALRDPELAITAKSFLEADQHVRYWSNSTNSRAEISRRAADRDAWTPLANRDKLGACVAGALLPDEKDVAILGAGALSKTFRNRVTPVLGPLMAAADCGEAVSKIENARKQVGELNAAIQEISSGRTLQAHRSSRSSAEQKLATLLLDRVSKRHYRFSARQVVEVLDGRSVAQAFLR